MKKISESQIFDIKKGSILTLKNLAKLEEASRFLGEINQVVTNVFEYDFINEALKNIESLNSARIEGTTGNLEDLYRKDSLDYEKKKALKLFSAINVRSTINELDSIVENYKRLDLSLIRHLHKTLTEKDPATKGIPGKFREKDVHIKNSKLGDFYPPSHLKVGELMSRFAKDISMDENPYLIRAAISHYWFEAVHPFEDGNGRTGRLLITAMLLQKGILKSPILNVSQYFEGNRDEYIKELRNVTDDLSYASWVEFFLDAIIDQCKHNMLLIAKLRELKEDHLQLIRENIKGTHVPVHILDYALNNMYLTVPDTSKYLEGLNLPLKAPMQTARVNIKKLTEMGILDEMGKSGKEKVYVHRELKNIITDNSRL